MASTFAITTPANTVQLDGNRRSAVTFTATNTTHQIQRGRARVVSDSAAAASWFSIAGETERDFPADGTHQYTVQIQIQDNATLGTYTFRLGMVGVANPDEDYTESPVVSFTLTNIPPRPVIKTGYLVTAIGASIGILAGITLGLILGLLLAFLLEEVLKIRNVAGNAFAVCFAGGPWLGAVLGSLIALQMRGYEHARSTALVLAGIALLWIAVAAFILNLAGNSNNNTLTGILLFAIFVLSFVVPALAARSIVLIWKTGKV